MTFNDEFELDRISLKIISAINEYYGIYGRIFLKSKFKVQILTLKTNDVVPEKPN